MTCFKILAAALLYASIPAALAQPSASSVHTRNQAMPDADPSYDVSVRVVDRSGRPALSMHVTTPEAVLVPIDLTTRRGYPVLITVTEIDPATGRSHIRPTTTADPGPFAPHSSVIVRKRDGRHVSIRMDVQTYLSSQVDGFDTFNSPEGHQLVQMPNLEVKTAEADLLIGTEEVLMTLKDRSLYDVLVKVTPLSRN